MLASVAVYPTTPPGVVVAVLAVKSISSCETVTVAVHGGPGLPAGQLLPAEGELIVLVRILFPVPGLLTVTV